MKVRIGTFSIDFNEEAIRTAKKEAYIRDTARSLAWTGLDEKTLTQRITTFFINDSRRVRRLSGLAPFATLAPRCRRWKKGL